MLRKYATALLLSTFLFSCGGGGGGGGESDGSLDAVKMKI